MPEELKVWLQSVDLFQLTVAAGIIVYIIKVVFKTFLPSVAAMNAIVESVKDLPEDIPKLKFDLEETKKKVATIEARLNALVEGNLLPREEELDGNTSR